MKTSSILPALLSLTLLAAACGKTTPTAATAPKAHEHKAPHGGTAVELGEEAFHLELVLNEGDSDKPAGRLSAYVLDGEMENFIRVAAPSFEIVATVAGQVRPLVFRAIASTATGETVGNTSHFDVQADWLRTTTNFDAVLTHLEVKGMVFDKVPFNFPKGNDK